MQSVSAGREVPGFLHYQVTDSHAHKCPSLGQWRLLLVMLLRGETDIQCLASVSVSLRCDSVRERTLPPPSHIPPQLYKREDLGRSSEKDIPSVGGISMRYNISPDERKTNPWRYTMLTELWQNVNNCYTWWEYKLEWAFRRATEWNPLSNSETHIFFDKGFKIYST